MLIKLESCRVADGYDHANIPRLSVYFKPHIVYRARALHLGALCSFIKE